MTYPAHLAGTRIAATGTILADDSAPGFAAIGCAVDAVRCYCSERIVAGEQTARGLVRIAIDRNGASLAAIGAIIGRHVVDAVGIYGGETLPSAVATVDAALVPELHARLRETLPGFGCFAVLAPR